ncbi:hypothetical protein WMF38_36680 [Sorangium sp. So ce118]
MNKGVLSAAALMAGLVLVEENAAAGMHYQDATCHMYPDGSGNCNGNFRWYRDEGSNVERAYFQTIRLANGSDIFRFRAQLGAVVYVCEPTAALEPYWQQAMVMEEGYFGVSWNGSGDCTILSLMNGSPYRQY